MSAARFVICRRSAQTEPICDECAEAGRAAGVIDDDNVGWAAWSALRAWEFADALIEQIHPRARASRVPGDPGPSRSRNRRRK